MNLCVVLLSVISPVLTEVLTEEDIVCGKNKWICDDSSCIDLDSRCDGFVDCPDGSDETYPLCENSKWQTNWFRCTYGACVDGSVKEVIFKSSEKFDCRNGQLIPMFSNCGGGKDWSDGWDDMVWLCGNWTCVVHRFQCAYGARVDCGSDCNGKTECAAGSDESDELSKRIGAPTLSGDTGSAGNIGHNGTTGSTGVKEHNRSNQPSDQLKCVLPQHPEHGRYFSEKNFFAAPGEVYDGVVLKVTCDPGYGIDNATSEVLCLEGFWSKPLPQCVKFCKLSIHPSVEYNCLLTGDNVKGSKICDEMVPEGNTVRPECRKPGYYYPGDIKDMLCIDGKWDRIVVCKPECGGAKPIPEGRISRGLTAHFAEFPWHVGIYNKTKLTSYDQICGGTLVSTTAVISAAHCFWSDEKMGLLPSENYAVGLGKIYRNWDAVDDHYAQQSDVKEIKVTEWYTSVETSYQDDIAILILTKTIELNVNVRPVCLDFDEKFDREQLHGKKMGTVLGWGLTSANGKPSQTLQAANMPYVDIQKCKTDLPPTFLRYLTSDKICAGYLKDTRIALCRGDSGGGLVFHTNEGITRRYYLRGIVSTSPSSPNNDKCNENTYSTFTHVFKHHYFIRNNIDFD